jgi:ATP-binding cassette subfamily B (MDR/TAP) protein 1
MIKFTDAFATLGELRRQIERVPSIDSRNGVGTKLSPGVWKPSFVLNNVSFAYPSQPDKPVLRNLSTTFESGKVTAIVGQSGSGKSTLASLLMREYEPNLDEKQADLMRCCKSSESSTLRHLDTQGLRSLADSSIPAEQSVSAGRTGFVAFAGRDIRDYNVRWLRSQIAVVSQHPQLFSATVFENVAAGLTGTSLEYRPGIDDLAHTSRETTNRTALIRTLCCEAISKACAWDFVSKLPEGIDTIVGGGRGAGLSGGQRQRLAIARALVRKPACLILDEATSALDTETENAILAVLDKEVKERGMTIVMIANRLNTIVNADANIVLRHGRMTDQGSYGDLLCQDRPDQTFRKMVIEKAMVAETGLEPSGAVVRLERTRSTSNTAEEDSRLPHGLSQHDMTRDLEALSRGTGTQAETKAGSAVVQTMSKRRWLFCVGFAGAVLAGTAFPIAGWMTGGSIRSLSDVTFRPRTNTWSFWFLILAFVVLLLYL